MPENSMQSHSQRRYLNAADLNQNGQLSQLQYVKEDGFKLDNMHLIEDDAPAIGRPKDAKDDSWFERLHSGVIIRKILSIDRLHTSTAWLVFCGREATNNTHPLHIQINGHAIERLASKIAHPAARHYYTTDWGGAHFDNWFVVAIPPASLQLGLNEILLWSAATTANWEIMLGAASEFSRGSENGQRHHPDRSSRSLDSGKTWTKQLGWQGAFTGEYCIRLSLDQFAHKGTYHSSVINLVPTTDLLQEKLDLKQCQISWDLDIPQACAAKIRIRWSNSPRPNATSWTCWSAVENMQQCWDHPAGRYVQFSVTLSTNDPLISPLFRGVHINTQATPLNQSKARLVHANNGCVIRSSIAYVHEDPTQLADLRQRFELDNIIAGAPTEFAAQVRLMRWAYTVPIGDLDRYHWDYRDLPQEQRDTDNRLVQQGPYPRRRRDQHCLFCNLTLIAACIAMGYPARWVNVSTKHTYGHEVAEIWSNDFNKWVMFDATRDYYLCCADSGLPLNLVEISQRLETLLPAPATWEFPIQHWLPNGVLPEQLNVVCPQGDNPYPVFTPQVGSEDLILMGHLQMPWRSDFTSRPHPLPWRISSNWGSDQFYCWYSDTFPRKREYAHHTSRWQDFNPTLNQSEIFLCQHKDGMVQVEVDTETPWFTYFLIQYDTAEWRIQPSAAWNWQLHPGLNRLAVKTRNRAGVCGPLAYVELAWPG